MKKQLLQGSVRSLNTMAVNAHCSKIFEIHSEQDLLNLDVNAQPFYILGEGSNTLFVENETPTLVRPLLKGVTVNETETSYELKIGAGENWHKLVEYTVSNNMPGLENLALIPGSVGAAPVQNIGAYGVELAQFCVAVNWFCFKDREIKTLPKQDCCFSYRESIFKQGLKNRGIITSVSLSLPKCWQPCLSYHGLDQLASDVTPKKVMERVIEIRSSKLPDPLRLPNTGSFFKNPVVSTETFQRIKQAYSDIPSYPQKDGSIKLAAGWLIEQAGLKGYRQGDAGVHDKQALVIVNHGQATGRELLNLAQYIIEIVDDKFGVTLVPEVRLVASNGEKSMAELSNV